MQRTSQQIIFINFSLVNIRLNVTIVKRDIHYKNLVCLLISMTLKYIVKLFATYIPTLISDIFIKKVISNLSYKYILSDVVV